MNRLFTTSAIFGAVGAAFLAKLLFINPSWWFVAGFIAWAACVSVVIAILFDGAIDSLPSWRKK